jgi:hypothetical protein
MNQFQKIVVEKHQMIKKKWAGGWVDGWMGEWLRGQMDIKPFLWIAYSNNKSVLILAYQDTIKNYVSTFLH